MVTLAALGLVGLAGRDSARPSTYVVARHDIELGTRLTADDLRLAPIDLPAAQARRALRDVDVATGSVLVAPLAQGELIQRSALAPATRPELPVEVSVAVARARAVNGRLVPGEPVTVLGTFGMGESAVTRAVVRDARVVEIHTGDAGLTQSADVILTLAVATTADGIAISHASQAAEITILRAPVDAGTVAPSAGAG
jgi:Flp pilus assembly protein CpaB